VAQRVRVDEQRLRALVDPQTVAQVRAHRLLQRRAEVAELRERLQVAADQALADVPLREDRGPQRQVVDGDDAVAAEGDRGLERARGEPE
jgi:hypothetical protein